MKDVCMQPYDLAIVGAGLAGLFAARRMAEQGFSVALIDRKEDPGQGVQTTGIFVRKTFEDYPFLQPCLGPPLSEVRLFSPRGRVIEMASPTPEFRVGDMPGLYRDMLAAARSAGVVWLPRTRFLGLAAEGTTQRLFLQRQGEPQELHCRFVVGADGARSRVAVALGLHRNHRFLVGAEEIYQNQAEPALQPGLYCYLDPKLAPGYLAWVSVDFHEKHVGVAGLTGSYSPRSALTRFIEKVGPSYGIKPDSRTESRGGLIPVGGIGTRIANAHGLLIGDATGAVSPLTAGGLDPCLRLTEYACSVAKAFLATGAPQVLAAYSGQKFRARFAKRLFLRKVMDRMTSPLFLELGFSLMALPPFRSLAEDIFFRRGSFPDPGPVPGIQPDIPTMGL